MPTLEHNALVDMFRERPELAPRFLATLFHLDVPPHTSVAVVDSSLDQLIPVEFRADLVLELRDAAGGRVLAIILEVQRDKDPDKPYSWAVYVAVVHAQKRCPTVVLVVAPDAGVASWAAQPIDLGLGLGTVRAVVLGPASVPELTDPAVAEREPELAVLSAVAHGNGPQGVAVLKAALVALGRLDQEHAAVYFEVVWNAVRGSMQKALEALIMERKSEGQGEKALLPSQQWLIDIGKRAGLREGLRDGELDGLRKVLLRLLDRAGIALTEDDRARVQACADAAILERWA